MSKGKKISLFLFISRISYAVILILLFLLIFWHDGQYMQLCQLARGDRGRRSREKAISCGGLGKSYDVSDALPVRHEHDQAVETKGKAAMRRGAVLKSPDQEAEFLLDLSGGEAQQRKDLLLQLLIMDTYASPGDLNPVIDQVISLRTNI